LEEFWRAHTPTAGIYSRQYMNAVFYHDKEQERLAKETRDRIAAKVEGEVTTQILPASTFYLAEDYHQKYSLQGRDPYYRELAAIYPTTEELIASTAAARINGYLGGYGTREQLERELEGLGLSPEAGDELLQSVRR
jgi:hypothetical protein